MNRLARLSTVSLKSRPQWRAHAHEWNQQASCRQLTATDNADVENLQMTVWLLVVEFVRFLWFSAFLGRFIRPMSSFTPLSTLQWASTLMRFFPLAPLPGSSIHALRMLRSYGLGSPQLHVIARSTCTTLASMLYASPAWWGFTSARDKKKLIGRLQRGGFLPDDVLSFA